MAESGVSDGPSVVALREIAKQRVKFAAPVKDAVDAYIAETKAAENT